MDCLGIGCIGMGYDSKTREIEGELLKFCQHLAWISKISQYLKGNTPVTIDPWKFGHSYWKPPFLGAMLVLGSVHATKTIILGIYMLDLRGAGMLPSSIGIIS